MALIVGDYPVVFNLPAIYKDLGMTCAQLRDNLEMGFLSSDSSKGISDRLQSLFYNGETLSDGYLLVYNFKSKHEMIEFILKAQDYGLEQDFHLAGAYCLWLQKIDVTCSATSGSLKFKAVSHIDNPTLSLSLTVSQKNELSFYRDYKASISTIRLSMDYVAYQNRTHWEVMSDSIRSLLKTGFSHINYYMPKMYSESESSVAGLSLTSQLLPGILSLLTQGELNKGVKFEFKAPYMHEDEYC